jgi:hypothetical protein
MAVPRPEFFAPLKRRANYSKKSNGDFYSYEYYRENFRHEIADDCAGRCVYCDCHEHEVGGRESMELDHLRPWSRPEFAHLKNDPTNFNHACGRCNRLKGAKWPSSSQTKPHDGRVGFIDPFNDDRRLYFRVKDDGTLICLQPPSAYLVRILALNRPLLKLLRVRRILRLELTAYIEEMLPKVKAVEAGSGTLDSHQLAAAFRKVCEYQRLLDLCDAPIDRIAQAPKSSEG